MSFSSLPRAGSALTAAVLAVTLTGCGSDPVGPDKIVSIIEIFPKSAQLYAVGQEVTFTADITTEAGTSGSGIEVGFVARDKSLLEVNSSGVAKALKKGGSTYVVVTAGGKSDSALVEVPLTTCGTVTPTAMSVGQVVTDIGESGFCAAGSAGEYSVIVHNNSLSASGSSVLELKGIGLGIPPAAGGASFARNASTPAWFGTNPRLWQRDVAAEMRFRREAAAAVAPFAATGRKWYESRKKRASFAAAPPAVGDLMTVNVAVSAGSNGCTAARTDVSARVAAVSNTAIVLSDPRNPAGGFTDAEYNEFAQMFDSVINPLSIAQFGAPTDIDGNQRVLLVFTKAVNDRSTAAGAFISGLMHPRDLVPRSDCAGSNEAEMFYLLAPDPNNQNFTKTIVSAVTDVTIAHEYQHLINFARRRYILPATIPNVIDQEELWLNEGLSHMAEDLLFYRRSGIASRNNFGGADFTTQALFDHWRYYASGNLLSYEEYMKSSTTTSPFEAGDEPSTRGATVAFLRYVADQKRTADGNLWFDLVNSGQAGITNLQNRLGVTSAEMLALLRDFTISTYADDHVTGVAAKHTQPSWNMRTIFAALRQIYPDAVPPFNWPLATTALEDAEPATVTVQAGGFRVYRFRGLSGTDSFIRPAGLAGAAYPAGMTISVIRTQ